MADSLKRFVSEIRSCRLCVEQPKGRPLPHDPRPVFRVSRSARLCVAGQAPGTRVHASGIPFTDPSGDRLRAWMGVTQEEFYDTSRVAIIPMGFCFPGLDDKGGDLPPRPECAARWRSALFDRLGQIDLVLLVGQYAQSWHLGALKQKTLTDTVRAWQSILETTQNPRFLPLPHPSWRNNAWIRKNPWFEADLVPRLQREVRALL